MPPVTLGSYYWGPRSFKMLRFYKQEVTMEQSRPAIRVHKCYWLRLRTLVSANPLFWLPAGIVFERLRMQTVTGRHRKGLRATILPILRTPGDLRRKDANCLFSLYSREGFYCWYPLIGSNIGPHAEKVGIGLQQLVGFGGMFVFLL